MKVLRKMGAPAAEKPAAPKLLAKKSSGLSFSMGAAPAKPSEK